MSRRGNTSPIRQPHFASAVDDIPPPRPHRASVSTTARSTQATRSPARAPRTPPAANAVPKPTTGSASPKQAATSRTAQPSNAGSRRARSISPVDLYRRKPGATNDTYSHIRYRVSPDGRQRMEFVPLHERGKDAGPMTQCRMEVQCGPNHTAYEYPSETEGNGESAPMTARSVRTASTAISNGTKEPPRAVTTPKPIQVTRVVRVPVIIEVEKVRKETVPTPVVRTVPVPTPRPKTLPRVKVVRIPSPPRKEIVEREVVVEKIVRKVVEKRVEVPVEVVKEVIKEVPVDRVVYRDVVKVVEVPVPVFTERYAEITVEKNLRTPPKRTNATYSNSVEPELNEPNPFQQTPHRIYGTGVSAEPGSLHRLSYDQPPSREASVARTARPPPIVPVRIMSLGDGYPSAYDMHAPGQYSPSSAASSAGSTPLHAYGSAEQSRLATPHLSPAAVPPAYDPGVGRPLGGERMQSAPPVFHL